jgi:hypothetical protein
MRGALVFDESLSPTCKVHTVTLFYELKTKSNLGQLRTQAKLRVGPNFKQFNQ